MTRLRETKKEVKAVTFAGATAGLILWLIGYFAFSGPIPEPIQIFVPAAVATAAGWIAPHTDRSQT